MSGPVLTRPDALCPVLVASHPRSGTHLVMDLLRRQFRSLYNWRIWGLPLDHLYLNLERLGARKRRFSDARARRIVNRPRRALMKTHFDAGLVVSWDADESVPPSRPWRDVVSEANVVYVLRHPMDVMASHHQFMSGLDETIADLDLMSFLRSAHWDGSMHRLEWWHRHVSGWAGREDVTVLRYEDVVGRTGEVLCRVARLLDEEAAGTMPLLPPKITTKGRTRLDRLLHLSPPSTAIIADRDRFRAHDWRKSLKPQDIAWLERQIGQSLARFGYTLDPACPVKGLQA